MPFTAFETPTVHGEAPNFPRGEWDSGIFTGMRRIIVGWDHRVELLTEMGSPAKWSWPYPDGTPYAIARRAKVDPWPDEAGQVNDLGSQEAAYEQAAVTVWYTNAGPRWINNSVLVEESIDPVADIQYVDTSTFKWFNGAQPAFTGQESVRRLLYSFDYVLKFHRIAAIPAYIQSRVGYVNSNTVTAYTLGMVFPPETLLYKPPQMQRAVTVAGNDAWNITIRYGYHPAGWNTALRATTGAYEPYADSSGVRKRIYPLIAF